MVAISAALFLVLPGFFTSSTSVKAVINTNFSLTYSAGGTYEKEFPLTLKDGDELNVQASVDSNSFQARETANFIITDSSSNLYYESTPTFSATQVDSWTPPADGDIVQQCGSGRSFLYGSKRGFYVGHHFLG
ncbi:MAG: hypothetical protein ACLQO7_05585 [Candidatus Bathyarchaeia archaeon]